MKKDRHEMLVGLFVISGLILLTLSIFFVSGVYFFRTGYTVDVVYQYVSILDKGAPVRMAGVRVGEVSQVSLKFDESAGKSQVFVKLFIEKGVEIRENYLFYIRGTHILSEPHIEISPQPGSAELINPGVTVIGVDPTPVEDLIQRANHIAVNIDKFFATLGEAVDDSENKEAVRNILLNLAKLSESLKVILSGNEGELQEAIRNMSDSAESLNRVLGKIGTGEGSVGKLLMRDEIYDEMLALVKDIRAHPWKLLKKDGGRTKIFGIF